MKVAVDLPKDSGPRPSLLYFSGDEGCVCVGCACVWSVRFVAAESFVR